MNEEWVETTLGEVALINPDKTPKWTDDHEIRYVDIASVSAELGINLHEVSTVQFGEAPGRARRLIRSGDVLVSTVRPNLRAFAQVPPSLDGQVASTGFAVLRGTERALPGFLWAVVRSEMFVAGMIAKCTGTNYPAIRAEDVASFPVLLPPLPVQRRIVDLMAHLDNQIANLRLERDTAKVSADALSESLICIHPVQSVRDVADENRGLVGGPFGSSLVSKDYSETGVPVVRGTNMPKTGRYLQPPFVFVSSEKADSLKANWAMDGDVVFTQRGTLGQVGLVAVGQGPLVISQSQMRLRPNPSMALSEYVYYAFSRPSVVSGIEDLNTATANPHINLGILAAIEFPVPSLEIQRAICVDLAAAYDLSAALQAEIESLLAFRSVLLSQLLTNKIGLPETYDSLLEVVA